jgi:hypothetical protein
VTTVEQLDQTLAALSLTAVAARLEALLEQAAKQTPSYADFLQTYSVRNSMPGVSGT